MGFVNEYVSEEEIEKYDLDSLYNKYTDEDIFFNKRMPQLRLGGFVKYNWTIDRERSIWLMLMQTVHSRHPDFSPSGYPAPTGERIFVLSIQGEYIEIRVKKLQDKSSKNDTYNPYYLYWQFLSIIPSDLPNVSHKQLIQIISEAMNVYGVRGISYQIPNTIVKFEEIGE